KFNKKGQSPFENFLPPVFKRRKSLSKGDWPFLLNLLDPSIEVVSCVCLSCGSIPRAQGFFQLPCLFKSGESRPNLFPFPCFFFCQILLCPQKEVLFPMQEDHAFFSVCPTGKDFAKRFHDMLNDVKMIHDDLRFW